MAEQTLHIVIRGEGMYSDYRETTVILLSALDITNVPTSTPKEPTP